MEVYTHIVTFINLSLHTKIQTQTCKTDTNSNATQIHPLLPPSLPLLASPLTNDLSRVPLEAPWDPLLHALFLHLLECDRLAQSSSGSEGHAPTTPDDPLPPPLRTLLVGGRGKGEGAMPSQSRSLPLRPSRPPQAKPSPLTTPDGTRREVKVSTREGAGEGARGGVGEVGGHADTPCLHLPPRPLLLPSPHFTELLGHRSLSLNQKKTLNIFATYSSTSTSTVTLMVINCLN